MRSIFRHFAYREVDIEGNIWRQQAGKKESVSLCLVLEVSDVEIEEELSTMATLFWAEGVRMNRWRGEQRKSWRDADF